MFSILWNYLRGYVIIEVRGFAVTRFLNMVSKNGITIWKLLENKNGFLMCVSVKDFKKLRPFIRKSKCHIKIKKRCGLPFKLKSLKRKQLYILGVTLFIFSLYILSSFIWLIEIKGNSILKTKDILDYCNTINFSVGSHKSEISLTEIEKQLKNQFPEISWISINIKGTKATIQLRETLPKIDIIQYSEPCNIIADKNTIIDSIVTEKGIPLVKKGDTVTKGETLVSGEIEITGNNDEIIKKYTHSFAKIRGRTTYIISAKVPFVYYTKKYSENVKNSYKLKIFDYEFSIYNPDINFKNYDTYNSLKRLSITEDYPLPFIFNKTINKEFEYIKKTYSFEEAKKRGEKLINNKILQIFDINTDIIKKTYKYEKNDEELIVTANINVIEDIGKEQKIN